MINGLDNQQLLKTMFDAKEMASAIKTEATKRFKDGLHPNLSNSIYEVYGEIGQEVIQMLVEANEEEKSSASSEL